MKKPPRLKKKRGKNRPAADPRRWDTSILAPIAVCSYVAGFAFPDIWMFSLLSLGVFGLLAILFSKAHGGSGAWPPLALPWFLLVLTTVLSCFASEDMRKSFILSLPFFPAALVFFLVAQHFTKVKHIRFLYVTFCSVALGLACKVLWAAAEAPGASTRVLALAADSPIFLVPNDITFLAVIAPLSLALLFRKPRGWEFVLVLSSLVLSIGAIVVLQSRTAILTLIATLTCLVVLVSPRRRLALGLVCLAAVVVLGLLIDWAFGSPLSTKFLTQLQQRTRLRLWSTAWTAFLQAPFLGHGPGGFGQFHRIPWAHNLYLEFLAERGILGFAAFGTLLVGGEPERLSALLPFRHNEPHGRFSSGRGISPICLRRAGHGGFPCGFRAARRYRSVTATAVFPWQARSSASARPARRPLVDAMRLGLVERVGFVWSI